jgi:hypothetical protein
LNIQGIPTSTERSTYMSYTQPLKYNHDNSSMGIRSVSLVEHSAAGGPMRLNGTLGALLIHSKRFSSALIVFLQFRAAWVL